MCSSYVQMIDSYKPPQSSVVMILNPKKPAWDLNLLPWDSWVLLVSWIHTCYVHLCISAAISHAGASECYGLSCWKPDEPHKGRFNYTKVYHPNFQAPTHLYVSYQLLATVTPNFPSLTATQPSVVYVVGIVTVSCGFYFCCSASSWVPPEWHCWADAEHDEATTPRAGHLRGEGGWSWESFTIRVLRVSWRFGWVYITTFMC